MLILELLFLEGSIKNPTQPNPIQSIFSLNRITRPTIGFKICTTIEKFFGQTLSQNHLNFEPKSSKDDEIELIKVERKSVDKN